MTTSPPPAGPRTQQIPTAGDGATAASLVEQPAAVPPSALPAPAYPVTSPQPVATADPGYAPPAPHHGGHQQAVHHHTAHHGPATHGSAAHQPTGSQPTGPLDSLLGAPPVPPSAVSAPRSEAPAAPRARRAPRDRAALVAGGLAVVGLVLLEVGLLLRPHGSALWSDVPAWSAFATLCALLGGVAAAARLVRALRLRPAGAEWIALGGVTGLAVFWALVVLPHADTDRGFVLTAALAAVAAAAWLVPGRRR